PDSFSGDGAAPACARTLPRPCLPAARPATVPWVAVPGTWPLPVAVSARVTGWLRSLPHGRSGPPAPAPGQPSAGCAGNLAPPSRIATASGFWPVLPDGSFPVHLTAEKYYFFGSCGP